MVSGHQVVWLHHLEKGRQAFEGRYVSTGYTRAQPVVSVCIGGDGGHWWDGYMGDWVCTWGLLGMVRKAVSASEMMVEMEVLAKSRFVVRPCNKMKKNH